MYLPDSENMGFGDAISGFKLALLDFRCLMNVYSMPSR